MLSSLHSKTATRKFDIHWRYYWCDNDMMTEMILLFLLPFIVREIFQLTKCWFHICKGSSFHHGVTAISSSNDSHLFKKSRQQWHPFHHALTHVLRSNNIHFIKQWLPFYQARTPISPRDQVHFITLRHSLDTHCFFYTMTPISPSNDTRFAT